MKPNWLRVISLLILASAALTAQVARQDNVVPLKNWATPLYWQPSQTENLGSAVPQPQLQFSPNQVSTGALTFIAITPCRLIDTRGASANFNGIAPFSGPPIAATTMVTFPVQSASEASADTTPAPCGTIPSIAEAYSLNLTVVPAGGGAVDYISMWPSGYPQPFVATLNDPQGAIVANAAIVPAGTPSGGISVYNQGPSAANVIIDMNGFFAAPSDLNYNTAVGNGTLLSNTSGSYNTSIGNLALESNTTGSNNTATGAFALQINTTGAQNTAYGASALNDNSTGTDNTATGALALQNNNTGSSNTANGNAALGNNIIGSNNTASGQAAMTGNSNGSYNTAYGSNALLHNTTGNYNVAIGYNAALAVPASSSYNIDIGSGGGSDDNGVIRIGSIGSQASTYIAGIWNNTPNVTNLLVCVDANGDLGTTGCTNTPSSRRFKDEISEMGDSSSKLFQLRPVTFLYKPEYDDGSHSLQYGLIAEEVAKIYPDMVGYDKDGRPSSVKYQALAPMLLNEVQKQNAQLQQQNARLQKEIEDRQAEDLGLKDNLQLQKKQNQKLEDRIATLETLFSSQSTVVTQPGTFR